MNRTIKLRSNLSSENQNDIFQSVNHSRIPLFLKTAHLKKHYIDHIKPAFEVYITS